MNSLTDRAPLFFPSKGRYHRRLRVIDQAIEAKRDVYVVVEPQEVQQYQSVYGDEVRYHVLGDNDRGVAFARNAIVDFGREANIPVWMIDDDCTSYVEGVEPSIDTLFSHMRKTTLDNLLTAVEEGTEQLIDELDYPLIYSAPCFAQTMREYPAKPYRHNRLAGNFYYLLPGNSDVRFREDMLIRSDVCFMLDNLLQGQPSMLMGIVNNVSSHLVSTILAKKDAVWRAASGFDCRRCSENFHG